jgi:hypothetical protein
LLTFRKVVVQSPAFQEKFKIAKIIYDTGLFWNCFILKMKAIRSPRNVGKYPTTEKHLITVVISAELLHEFQN